MIRALIAVIAGLLLGLAQPPAAAGIASTEGPDLAASGRVLVLLRLPPPHFRAGSDYGGSYGDGAGRAARHRLAAALARRHGLALVDDWPMPLLGVDCFVMRVPPGQSPTQVAATLSDQPGVAWSQPDNGFASKAAIPAAATARRDALFQVQPAALGWHLADLHRIADGRGVRVAIVDSAIDRRHPDLVGQVPIGASFVAGQSASPERHGTAVAGIVAAIAGNGIGIAGIAPQARLMALRACWEPVGRNRGATVCNSFSLAKAIYFALENGALVLNLSLGGPPDPLLARLLDLALARRITVVAAFDRTSADGGFPASHPGVVAVADAGPGPLPPGVYSAPGNGIPTTEPGGGWRLVDGSSFAAAHVTGLFALMRAGAARGVAPPALVAGRNGAIDSCASLVRASRCNCTCPARSAAVSRP